MFEILEGMNYWHWLALGLALLAAELIGTAGYMLWLGISAILVGIILAVIPVSWQLQWVSFGVFSLLTTWLWWRRQLNSDSKDDQSRDLNQKDKQLVGQIVTLKEDVSAGKTRIRLGDTTWSAYTETALAKGTIVEVTQVKGITLTIKAKNDEPTTD